MTMVVTEAEMRDNSLFWVKLDSKLEDLIGTEMFDDLRVYLEAELRMFLKLKLPRIVLKAKYAGVKKSDDDISE